MSELIDGKAYLVFGVVRPDGTKFGVTQSVTADQLATLDSPENMVRFMRPAAQALRYKWLEPR